MEWIVSSLDSVSIVLTRNLVVADWKKVSRNLVSGFSGISLLYTAFLTMLRKNSCIILTSTYYVAIVYSSYIILNSSRFLVKYAYSMRPDGLVKISKWVLSGLKRQSYIESKISVRGHYVISRTHLRDSKWFFMIRIETTDNFVKFASLKSLRSLASKYILLSPCSIKFVISIL